MNIQFKTADYTATFSNDDTVVTGKQILCTIIPQDMVSESLVEKFASFIVSKQDGEQNTVIKEKDVVHWLQSQPLAKTCKVC